MPSLEQLDPACHLLGCSKPLPKNREGKLRRSWAAPAPQPLARPPSLAGSSWPDPCVWASCSLTMAHKCVQSQGKPFRGQRVLHCDTVFNLNIHCVS